jgi:predicted CopG family antitoxin
MLKNFLFNLDLISNGTFSEEKLVPVKEEIEVIGEGLSFSDIVIETVQLTKDNRIEIYLENEGISDGSAEEVLTFVKSLEKFLGGFIPGSSFEWIIERWVKGEYAWELSEEIEDDGSWEDDTYWEDEWEEWNDEWN